MYSARCPGSGSELHMSSVLASLPSQGEGEVSSSPWEASSREASYMPRADVFSMGEACREAYEGLHVPVQGENWVLGQGGMLFRGQSQSLSFFSPFLPSKKPLQAEAAHGIC